MTFRPFLTIGVSVAALLAAPAGAQQAQAPTVLTVHPLRGGAYWVSGGRSNAGFVVGDQGVVVIDTQTSPPDGQKQVAEIAKVTRLPINTIILTHSDPDHIGGLPSYPAGVAIIAHEDTRATILASDADPNGPPMYKPLFRLLASKYLPTQTLQASESTVIDGVPMQLIHVAPAHSSGDVFVYLPKQKIVYGGDILVNEHDPYPVIHIGGSSEGWIESMKAMLALDADLFVSGHGAMMSRAELQQHLGQAQQRRSQIKAMVYAGKSLSEVEAALPEPGANAMFPDFDQTVYQELLKGYPPAVAPWANLVHH